MSFRRAAVCSAGLLRALVPRTAAFCSTANSALLATGLDESLEHSYATPFIGIASEIMKNPYTMNDDFTDFYNLLCDRPLSFEEIDKARAIFATGFAGPRFQRAWLYSSLQACGIISNRTMGHSFVHYFLNHRDVRTPANFVAVLIFLSLEFCDLPRIPEVIEMMKQELDEDDWKFCASDVRRILRSIQDWRTLMDLGQTLSLHSRSFYKSSFAACMELLDLRTAREVVAKFRDKNIKLPAGLLVLATKIFEVDDSTSVELLQTYLGFMELIFQELNLGVMEHVIQYEIAETVVDWFTKLPHPKWTVALDCKTKSRGKCSQCRTSLPQFQLNKADRMLMRDDLKDSTFTSERKLYASKHLFESFMGFMYHSEPFDMVIDYENFIRVRPSHMSASLVFKILSQLIEEYKLTNILFVGKGFGHLPNIEKFVKKMYPGVKLASFTVGSVYKDDAFLLYAAITHNSYLVSNDAYRDHLALLPDVSRTLWKQWLVYRQIVIRHSGEITHPVSAMPVVSGSLFSGRLHLPHLQAVREHAQSVKHNFICLHRQQQPQAQSRKPQAPKKKGA